MNKEENRVFSCEEAALKVFSKNSGKNFPNKTSFSMNRKEGKKI